MSFEENQILKTIDGLYEAALNPALWPAALDRVGDLLGQTSLLMTMLDHRDNVLGRSITSRIDPHSVELFHREYNTPETNPNLGGNYLRSVGQLVFTRDVCNRESFLKSGVYVDCYRPEGLLDEVNVILRRTKTSMTGLAIMGQARRGTFGGDDVRLIRGLIPHFQRAVQVLSHMEEIEAQRQALSDTLDHVEFGIVSLRADGRVVVANRVAQEIACQMDGLLLSTSGLATSNPAETERLSRLIAAATRQRSASGGTMVVSRPSGRKALSLLTCPLAGHDLDSGSHRAVVTVFITDPERRIDGLQERLASLYGLTQREAMLASLLTQGQDLREASEHLGISLSTVQSHLKHILEKTGTHRQAECVALFLRSLAPVRGY